MYWYRLETALGRNSLVGTTIKNPEFLPKHISADEKHTRIKGEKAYIPCTVGENCILGADVQKAPVPPTLKPAMASSKRKHGN